MTLLGHVHNGVVVPDQPETLPEGATVRIEVVPAEQASVPPRRIGGVWKGQVHLSEDFDELPPDLAEAFGMNQA